MGKGLVTAMGAQLGQSTPATQALFGMAGGKRMASRRKRIGLRPKRKAPRTTRGKQSRKRPRKARPARMVKGSMAAKRYMAKIRRKRRK
jgi:hypothetical protein